MLDFKLEYFNNCVNGKKFAWIKYDIKVVTEFPCLLGYPIDNVL